MDLVVILLIALAVIVVIGVTFALVRHKQRSSQVLAAPEAFGSDANGPER